MKKLISLLWLVSSSIVSFAQFPVNSSQSSPSTNNVFKGAVSAQKGIVTAIYIDTTAANLDLYVKGVPNIFITTSDDVVWKRNAVATKWIPVGGRGEAFAGGVITSLPAIGNNPGVNITSTDFIVSQFYASQPPIATLSGGTTYEFTTSGSSNRTLNWTAGRQSATEALASVVVGGVSQVFSYPNPGVIVSGTKIVNVPNNTTSTFSNIVTTVDNKTATATTTFLWQNKIYAGFVSSPTPTDAEIIAATGSQYVGGMFSATRNQSGALSTPSSSKYVVFASPVSYGTPNIVINGLGLTYNNITRNFTNASGGVSLYNISVAPFPTAGQIDTYLVN